jgi:hypothetical protein
MTPAEHNAARQPMLKAFLDHEIPPWRRLAVRLHLARCTSCREEIRAMQQIGEELRGQQPVDPLDPGLRSRILATVRDLTPGPTRPVQARRPVLIWGAAAAVLLLVAVFAPRFQQETGLKLSRDSSESNPNSASAGMEPLNESKTATPASPSQSRSGGRSSLATTPSTASEPQKQSAKQDYSRVEAPVAIPSGIAQRASGDLLQHRASVMGDIGTSSSKRMPASEASGVRFSDAHRKAMDGGSTLAGPGFGGGFDGRRQSKLHAKTRVGRTALPATQAVVLDRAGFDLNGYRFVAQDGRRMDVPFKKNLNAVRFARAADGKMALVRADASPILYLAPGDLLHNDAVVGSLWQPLPPESVATQALYVRPAPDWEQFLAMRWYPNMTVVGGLTRSEARQDTFTWLPGSHIQIGGVLYPGYAAYRAYADSHPDALRLRAVYDNPPPAVPAVVSPTSRNPTQPAVEKRRP